MLLAHDRRRIRDVAVTAHPTAAWTAQQVREAFPWDEAPRYLIHDRDHAFDALAATAKAMGIEERLTAPHAPWQNPFVERFVGSARRECFDHVIVFSEAGARKLMARYGSYYQKARTHLALDKDAPIPRPVMPVEDRKWHLARTDRQGRRPARGDRAVPRVLQGSESLTQHLHRAGIENVGARARPETEPARRPRKPRADRRGQAAPRQGSRAHHGRQRSWRPESVL
ncbi:MAG: hypothetical protein DMG02_06335 [Acidobacteria bacterium]|nr:MAG: hypothetical protein DMG02_06335 [Acidobacteriota bacterium]